MRDFFFPISISYVAGKPNIVVMWHLESQTLYFDALTNGDVDILFT